ncbi:hypothetical protein HK105_206109 [Polyrhizophydium stewartii]|uniref:Rab-GAP TBC domain-containing protein n=1 Tax=Polyrhizophydium stewartii TaxID=2732419 RepID=A0ABR4N491_9FUNG|nr:hypothetical protein HK105_001456 [Polyrhizophydium stewartii]
MARPPAAEPGGWSWSGLASSLFVANPEVPPLWDDSDLDPPDNVPNRDSYRRLDTFDSGASSSSRFGASFSSMSSPSRALFGAGTDQASPQRGAAASSSGLSVLKKQGATADPGLDAVSAQRLLERLELANRTLASDPKMIMVQNGSIRTADSTLQTLTVTPAAISGGESDDAAPADDTFWETLLTESDGRTSLARLPHLIAARIRTSGIPARLRSQLWLRIAGAHIDNLHMVYPALLAEHSSFENIIQRDVSRTFPKVELFAEQGCSGQKMLFNVLKAFSVFDRDVGYCQGLSFCAGIMLMQGMSEQEAFSLVVRLLEESSSPTPAQPTTPASGAPLIGIGAIYALRSCFLPDMAGLHQALFQHTELVRAVDPALDKHLRECGISATMYASQWFLTMFSYNFPLELVFRLFDIMLVDGAMLTMVRFSVAILLLNHDRILGAVEIESLLALLKGEQLVAQYRGSWNALIKDVLDVTPNITQSTLGDLKLKYLREQQDSSREAAKAEIQRLNELVKQLARERDKARGELSAALKENARLTSANVELKEKLKQNDELQLRMLKENQVLLATIEQFEEAKQQ